MIHQKQQIKLPFEALQKLFQKQRKDYIDYLFLKYAVHGIIKKSGRIAFNEVAAVSKIMGVTPKHFEYRILKRLTSTGFVIKDPNTGYILIAQSTINYNLNINKTKTNKLKGFEYNPFASLELPDYDRKKVDLLFLYHQLKNKANKINFKFPIVETASIQKADGMNRPLYNARNKDLKLIFPLDRMLIDLGYTNKKTLHNLLNDLELIKLIEVDRGKFNAITFKNDCNTYFINPLNAVRWSYLKKSKASYCSTGKKVKKVIKVIKKAVKKVKKIITSTGIEKAFSDMLESGLKECLIHAGYISQYWLNRKISVRMFANILSYCLNDLQLKAILEKAGFNNSNFLILKDSKATYNYVAAYEYERYPIVNFQKVVLVAGNGNYKGKPLISYKEASENEMNHIRLNARRINRAPENLDIS